MAPFRHQQQAAICVGSILLPSLVLALAPCAHRSGEVSTSSRTFLITSLTSGSSRIAPPDFRLWCRLAHDRGDRAEAMPFRPKRTHRADEGRRAKIRPSVIHAYVDNREVTALRRAAVRRGKPRARLRRNLAQAFDVLCANTIAASIVGAVAVEMRAEVVGPIDRPHVLTDTLNDRLVLHDCPS